MCDRPDPGSEMTPPAAILWTIGVVAVMVLAGAAGGAAVWWFSRL